MDLSAASPRFEALGNPTRLAIVRLLVRAGEGGLPVGRIQDELGLAGSTLSHHVKCLVGVGLVEQTRERTMLICRVNYARIRDLIGFLMAECCVDATAPIPPPGPSQTCA
jgi:DNA-binding transcriptional ArsR family regulator